MKTLLLLLFPCLLMGQFSLSYGDTYTLAIPDEIVGVWDIPGIGRKAFTPYPSALSVPPVYASGGDAQVTNQHYVSDDHKTLLTYNNEGVSIWDMSGVEVVSDKQGNYRLQTIDVLPPPSCEMLTPEKSTAGHTGEKAAGDCVEVYFEVDYDLFTIHSVDAANWVDAMLTQAWMVMTREDMDVHVGGILIWDMPSPYSGTTTGLQLNIFTSVRPVGTFDGTIAHLLSASPAGGGGIAYVDVICNQSVRHAFSRLNPTYNDLPVYSWNVMVILHETGHLLGSTHTHSCAWNGNNTPIDGCFTDPGCDPAPLPVRGTIMSYCHLRSNVGIDLTLGYGPQPGDRIRGRIASATCLVDCGGGGDGGGGDGGGDPPVVCTANELILTVSLTCRPEETTIDIDGLTYGPFGRSDTTFVDTLCVQDGCITMTVRDSYGDGLEGVVSLRGSTGTLQVGSFSSAWVGTLCFGGSVRDECDVDLSTAAPFGFTETFGSITADTVLTLRENTWAYVFLDTFSVTADTRVSFWMRCLSQGEIGGVGLAKGPGIQPSTVFNIYGVQAWYGFRDYTYTPNSGWVYYDIPLAEYIAGEFDRIVFIADDDRRPFGVAYYEWYDVRIGDHCEGTGNGAAPPLRTPNINVLPGSWNTLGQSGLGRLFAPSFSSDGVEINFQR